MATGRDVAPENSQFAIASQQAINTVRRTTDLMPRTLALQKLNFYTFVLSKKPNLASSDKGYEYNDVTGTNKDFTSDRFTEEARTGFLYYLTLPVNPQEYIENWPSRSNVIQTMGGAWVDHFGLGIGNIQFRGTTGWKRRRFKGLFGRKKVTTFETDGYTAIKDFRDKIYRAFHLDYDPQTNEDIETNVFNFGADTMYDLYLFNWANEDYYKVLPMEFVLTRSAGEPLLYRFSTNLIVLERVTKTSYAEDDWVAKELINASERLTRFETGLERAYWRNFIALEMLYMDREPQNLVDELFEDNNADLKQELRILMDTDNTKRIQAGGEDLHPSEYYDLLEDEELTGIAADASNPHYKYLQANLDNQEVESYGIGRDGILDRTQLKDKTQIVKTVYTQDGKVTNIIETQETTLSKHQRILNSIQDTKAKIRQTRERGEIFIREPLTNIKEELLGINEIIFELGTIPKEIFPYGLVRELRDTYCLFQSVLSFPQYLENSASKAYEDFISLIKDSGCATTIRRR